MKNDHTYSGRIGSTLMRHGLHAMMNSRVVVFAFAVAMTAVACKQKEDAAPSPAPAAKPSPAATVSAAAPAKVAYCGTNPCPCKAGSEDKRDEKLAECVLEQAAKVGDFECQPGRTSFHDDGSLKECMLTADTKVGNYTCKKGPLSIAMQHPGELRYADDPVGR